MHGGEIILKSRLFKIEKLCLGVLTCYVGADGMLERIEVFRISFPEYEWGLVEEFVAEVNRRLSLRLPLVEVLKGLVKKTFEWRS